MASRYRYLWDVTGFGPKNKRGYREGFKIVRVMADDQAAAVALALTLLPEGRREEPAAKQLARQDEANWDGPKAE